MGEKRNAASLEIVNWEKVRSEVIKVNPDFAEAIDELNPSEKYPLVKVAYPYGSYVLKRAELMLPNPKGVVVPITDSSIDSKLKGMLDYNLNSNPVSLVLSNTFEIFLPLSDRTIPMSGLIFPGIAFGAWRVLNPQATQQPAFIWDMTAGARSIFMLPKISEDKKHLKLKKTFGVTANKPDSLMEHFEIFKQIASHPDFSLPWQANILFFPRQWFEHLNDESWFKFYYHFYRSTWQNTEYWRNRAVWDLIFSIIIMNNKVRPNAYIADTVKYLLTVGIGAQAGFSPATNNLAGPISELQRVYIEEYEIKDYPPIIMHSGLFDINNNKQSPVYYSLQFPTAIEFSPKSRVRTSLITELHEIQSLLQIFEKELLEGEFNISGTPFAELFKKVRYDYFHNNVELHRGMRNSAEIALEDKNFLKTLDAKTHKKFPDTATFVKGCIRIAHKN